MLNLALVVHLFYVSELRSAHVIHYSNFGLNMTLWFFKWCSISRCKVFQGICEREGPGEGTPLYAMENDRVVRCGLI